MGRHSAPDDDGDLLVEPVAPARPLPRPRHASLDEVAAESPAIADESPATEVIEPELVERPPEPSPHAVIDAVVVEDESLPVPVSLAKPPAAGTEQPVAMSDAAPQPEADAAPVRRERATRTDLRMLRQDRALRARAAAAGLVPFVIYTVVLAVVGRFDAYLYWIWIPAILAGVLFGAQLDSATRRSGDQGTTSPSPPAP